MNGKDDLTVTADESTIGRWRNWFLELVDYFLGCLLSIAIRYGRDSVESASHLPKSTLQRIWHYVGDAPGWLARIAGPWQIQIFGYTPVLHSCPDGQVIDSC